MVLVAPEDLLSACCLVLPCLLLSFPPLPLPPWGSRASPGALLGLSWAHLGLLLGLSWGPFWASWRPLALQGLSWASPGSPLLGRPLGLLLSWASLGPLLAPSGVPWRALGSLVGTIELSFGPLGRLLAAKPRPTFHGTLQKPLLFFEGVCCVFCDLMVSQLWVHNELSTRLCLYSWSVLNSDASSLNYCIPRYMC